MPFLKRLQVLVLVIKNITRTLSLKANFGIKKAPNFFVMKQEIARASLLSLNND